MFNNRGIMKIIIVILMCFYSFNISASVLKDFNEFCDDLNKLNAESELSAKERMQRSLEYTNRYSQKVINEYTYNDFLVVKQMMKELFDKKEINKIPLLFAPYYNMMQAKKVSEEDKKKIFRSFQCEMNLSSIQASIVLFNSMNSEKISADNFNFDTLRKFEYYYNFNDFISKHDVEKRITPFLCTSEVFLDNSGYICCPEHGYPIPTIFQMHQKFNLGNILKNMKDASSSDEAQRAVEKELLSEVDKVNNIVEEENIDIDPKEFPVIAIMNFKNSSTNKELDALAFGFSDILTTDLISLKCVSIVERSKLNEIMDELKLSQMGVTDSEKAMQIGKLLSVHKIFMGTFTEFFGRLRIDVKAVNVETGKIDDAWQVYGKTEEFFELEKKLVKMIARSLKIKISENNLNSNVNAPRSLEVALIFSKGLDHMKAQRFEQAFDCFVECSKKDPSFLAPLIHTMNMFYFVQIERSLKAKKK